jgi:methyl-accepting chemotaxis protein
MQTAASPVALIAVLANEGSLEERSRQIPGAMTALSVGDFKVRLPVNWAGTDGRVAEAFNQAISNAQRISLEPDRLRTAVGKEGKLSQRMSAPGAPGRWAGQVDSLNTLIDDLVRPTTDIARAIDAVAKGDLGQSMELQVGRLALKGKFLRSAKLVNSMIEQLSVFTSEVTRVAREVGTEGKLGGQAQVPGIAGTWKDLTDSVKSKASNLTGQVRNIAGVATAIAKGDRNQWYGNTSRHTHALWRANGPQAVVASCGRTRYLAVGLGHASGFLR